MENLWKFSTMNLDQFRKGRHGSYICWICFCCHFDGKGNGNIQLEIKFCHEMTARSYGNSHVKQGTLPKNVFNWTIFHWIWVWWVLEMSETLTLCFWQWRACGMSTVSQLRKPWKCSFTLAYFALFCHVHRVEYEDMPYSSKNWHVASFCRVANTAFLTSDVQLTVVCGFQQFVAFDP